MRLRLASLALLAGAGAASAQPPPPEGEIYSAHGTEPFWGLTFEEGRMIWSEPNGDRIDVARPRPVTSRGAHVYRTPRLTVEISHEGRCNDGMSDYEYPDTVRIRFGRSRTGRALEGCGGGILPPVTLVNTGWAIADIGGAEVGGEAYRLNFEENGRLSGQAGCNRFSGSYTQAGRRLTAGPIAATRMACPAERMAHEAKVMQLLRGPIQISYRGGMIMTLQEEHGSPGLYLTLRRQ